MRKTNCVVPVTIGVLLSLPGFADEAKSFNTPREPLPAAVPSAKVWLAGLNAAHRLQFQPTEAVGFTRQGPIPDFDFQNASVLTRFGKVRSLALVTVAETRQARLFLGVNNDGVVGLHFSALPRRGATSNLEWLRLPYLAKHK